MIIDYFIESGYVMYSNVLDFFPNFDSFVIPQGILDWIISILNLGSYILPVVDMLIIFAFMVSVHIFRLVYNIVFKIWGSLPLT